MSEINIHNFNKKFEEIKKNIEAAKVIGIDLEFSALNPLPNYAPSLFDSPRQRYDKLRKNVENTIPVQIGLTAFKFDADGNSFEGSSYTFYVKPALFSNVDRYFHFESSSVSFLTLHNFDFNKLFYSGIPYLSKIQEEELRRRFKNEEMYETNMNFVNDIRTILDSVLKRLNEWYEEANNGDKIILNDLSDRYHCDVEFRYFFVKYIRRNFGELWVYQNEGEELTLEKVTPEYMKQIEKNYDLNEEIISAPYTSG